MRGSYKYTKGILLFFLLTAATGRACLTQARDANVKIKGKEEMLVAEDIGRGSSVYPVFWCGNDAIVVYNEEIGIELIEVPTGKRTKVSANALDYPFNCSPDGRWVVYMDRASNRLDKGQRVMTAEDYGFDEELDVWPVWEGYVADLYRFDVASGKKQRFAVVRFEVPAWEVVSPDGLKAFLGGKHNSSMDMPEPKWEPLWFSADDPKDWDWNQTEARWLKDSSGVVRPGHNRLYVEVFGKGGWAKRLAVSPEAKDSMFALTVDKNGGIYFLVSEGPEPQPDRFLMYRCALKDKELSCQVVLDRNSYIISYDILPAGDIIFTESGDNCIRRISPKYIKAECVAGGRYRAEIFMIGISPDGKRLAYETLNELFTIELVNE
ncbi:MAG: PD40 domain-containing protein [Deltaproteobacteria bacterium]|nr:PD40 domain-containing protein [Deltaproteobacteria bacterium]